MMQMRRGRVLLEPWTEHPHPDWDVMFSTDAGAWLLFHTTTPDRATRILDVGFEDHTARIGFDQRASAHGVFFGGVPAIPASIDYFHPGMMTAADIAWLVVEAPTEAWPDQAVSHYQDPTWPLYQVCYGADQVNAWPRRLLPTCDVLSFRPALAEQGMTWIREAVERGWLSSDVLEAHGPARRSRVS
jgi:hypothetical protein